MVFPSTFAFSSFSSSTPASAGYGFHGELTGLGSNQAVIHDAEALKTESFGVVAEIYVQATLEARLGGDRESHVEAALELDHTQRKIQFAFRGEREHSAS